ncbi:Uncharacterised protein [Mycobacteroides abscessus subsp. bolletii]|nr:Uncharacterised protein [Mycobacteroides abscessus subsp. bolletii]SKS56544.1 Uncharacterised protein [Mycobacteroides abscessus subsp. bolletii]
MFGDDEPFAPQFLDSLPNSHAGYAEMFDQFRLGGKPFAGAELMRFDCGPEHVRDLSVGRAIVRPVDLAKLQHQFSLPLKCLDD